MHAHDIRLFDQTTKNTSYNKPNPDITWAYFYFKNIHCLSEIQIQLNTYILYENPNIIMLTA